MRHLRVGLIGMRLAALAVPVVIAALAWPWGGIVSAARVYETMAYGSAIGAGFGLTIAGLASTLETQLFGTRG
ncbi:MAG: hypothetical protein AAF318_15810 [Pseudomonadota bacterium]